MMDSNYLERVANAVSKVEVSDEELPKSTRIMLDTCDEMEALKKMSFDERLQYIFRGKENKDLDKALGLDVDYYREKYYALLVYFADELDSKEK